MPDIAIPRPWRPVITVWIHGHMAASGHLWRSMAADTHANQTLAMTMKVGISIMPRSWKLLRTSLSLPETFYECVRPSLAGMRTPSASRKFPLQLRMRRPLLLRTRSGAYVHRRRSPIKAAKYLRSIRAVCDVPFAYPSRSLRSAPTGSAPAIPAVAGLALPPCELPPPGGAAAGDPRHRGGDGER